MQKCGPCSGETSCCVPVMPGPWAPLVLAGLSAPPQHQAVLPFHQQCPCEGRDCNDTSFGIAVPTGRKAKQPMLLLLALCRHCSAITETSLLSNTVLSPNPEHSPILKSLKKINQNQHTPLYLQQQQQPRPEKASLGKLWRDFLQQR